MTVVGRLNQNGELNIKGEVNERLPVITNGLVAHYPFDGTIETEGKNLLLNSDKFVNTTNWYTFQYSPVGLTGLATNLGIRNDGWSGNEPCLEAHFTHMDSGELGFGQIINTNPGEVYTLSGYMAGHRSDKQIVIRKNSTGEWITSTSVIVGTIYGNTLIADWYKINLKFTAVEETTRIDFELRNSNGDDSYLWVKRVKVENETFATTHTFAPEDNKVSGITTNCTLTNEGIAVEEGTTNLLPNPITLPASTWTARENVTVTYNQIDPFGTLNAIRVHPNTANDNYFGSRSTSESANTVYSGSIWLKATKNCLLPINVGTNERALMASVTTEWKKFIFTYTVVTASTYFHIGGWSTWTDNTFDLFIAYPQLEQKAFATSFVDGSRGYGSFSIPNPVTTGDFTINFKCKISSTVGSILSYGTVFSMGNYYSNNSFTIMDYSGSTVIGKQCLIRKGNAAEWAWADSGFFTDSAKYNDEYTYTIVRDSVNYRCYRNGVYTGSLAHMSTTMQPLIWIGSRDGGSSLANSVIKDLSIYNRALSDIEVYKLCNNKFSITKDGNINSLKINEIPNNIPNDAVYFPLGFDSKDKFKMVGPSTELNTSYKDGAVWVGVSATNIIGDLISAWNPWGGLTGTCTSSKSPLGTTMINFDSLTSGGCEYYETGGQQNAIAGATYYISAYVKSTNPPSANLFYLRQYRADGSQITEYGVFNYSNKTYLSDGWYWTYNTFTLDSTCTKFLIQGYEYSVTNIKLYGVMCSQTNYYPPFTLGTRGDSTLIIPTTGLIGSSSTILISYMPKTNISNTIISNATAGGQWWGAYHDGSGNIYMHEGVASNSASPGIPSKLNKWNQIAISWNDTTQYLYINGVLKGTVATNGTTNSSRIPNLYVGYGWNRGNAYYKDLIIVKRTLSDSEIFAIYKTKIRTTKDNNLYLQGILNEASL